MTFIAVQGQRHLFPYKDYDIYSHTRTMTFIAAQKHTTCIQAYFEDANIAGNAHFQNKHNIERNKTSRL